MEILRTFDDQYQGVYLARFVNCPFYKTPEDYETELSKIQDQLSNPVYVRNFIKSPRSGWKKGIYKNDALNFLAAQAIEEASDLFEKLRILKNQTKEGECFDLLFDNFEGISTAEKYDDPGRRKMYTYNKNSLLRIYGVLLGDDCLIVTGGGIKLVGPMQDSPSLQLELDKMDYLKQWLNSINVTDSTDLQL